MAGCASYSTLLTPVPVPRRGSPVFGDSPVPSSLRASPTLHLPQRRVSAGVSAAYSTAAAYTTTGPSASSSSSSSSSSSQQTSTFSAPAAAPPSLYDVLGLSAGATASEIKAAYRRLARSCHPDARNGDGAPDSGEQFMRVHAAYATLSDPDKRAEYDRRLAGPVPSSAGGRRAGPVYHRAAAYSAPAGYTGASSSFGRRTWETEQCW